MKCKDINIDSYLDRELQFSEQQDHQQHFESCRDCATKLENAESLLMGLKSLTVPEPSKGFEYRVLTEVRRQHKKSPRHGYRLSFASGFSTAVIASLAIWFVSTIYEPVRQVEQLPVVSVLLNQAQTVRLMFDSHKDIQQVKLSIVLPENMQLDGYPGRNTLAWQTSLHKGQNVLALPVVALAHGQGELLARLSYGEQEKVFRLVLKTSMNGARQYQLDEVITIS
ncbi:MAG: zf-HC2 domain-containing protein [Gammaproteobacteria bacterium]|nr:zf-HC2 domain-containing protein [Gammaproteobacteria bacterium]